LITPSKGQNIKRKYREVSSSNDKKDSEDGDNFDSDSGSNNGGYSGSDSDCESDGGINNSESENQCDDDDDVDDDDNDDVDDDDNDDDDGDCKINQIKSIKSDINKSSSSDNKLEKKDKEIMSIRTTIDEDNRKVINELSKQGEDVMLKMITFAFDKYLIEFLDKLTWLSNMRYILFNMSIYHLKIYIQIF